MKRRTTSSGSRMPISHVADSFDQLPAYSADAPAGSVMRANPAFGPGRGYSHLRTLDNEMRDLNNNIVTLDNEVGLAVLSQGLTNFAVGHPCEDNMEARLNALAAQVPTSRAFSCYEFSKREQWLMLLTGDKDIRAVGGDFERLGTGFKLQNHQLDEKGVTIRVDHRLGGNLPAVREAQTARGKNILVRTEIGRVFATLDANSNAEASENWGSGNANRDPDGTIIQLVDTSGTARGMKPSNVVFGGGADLKRILAYRALRNAGSMEPPVTDPAELAKLYRVKQVLIEDMLYQATAAAKARIVEDVVYGYHSQGNTMEDPSNLKRFVSAEAPSTFMVFVQEFPRYTDITIWHESRIVCPSPLGIFRQPVTYTA